MYLKSFRKLRQIPRKSCNTLYFVLYLFGKNSTQVPLAITIYTNMEKFNNITRYAQYNVSSYILYDLNLNKPFALLTIKPYFLIKF